MWPRFGLDGKTVKQQLGKSIGLRICKSHSIVTQLPDFIVLYFFVILFEISLFVLFVFLFKLRQILFSLGCSSTLLVKICININICIVSKHYRLIITTVCQHDETNCEYKIHGCFCSSWYTQLQQLERMKKWIFFTPVCSLLTVCWSVTSSPKM